MSRNLCKTSCDRCSGAVKLEESPRPARDGELGRYVKDFGHRRWANAHCETCGALYLAWIGDAYTGEGDAFSDLSYRSSFDDEPGQGDLPPWTPPPEEAQIEAIVHEESDRGGSEWDIARRVGRRVYALRPATPAPAGEAVDREGLLADLVKEAEVASEMTGTGPEASYRRAFAAILDRHLAARAPSTPSEADWIADRDQAIRDAEARGRLSVLVDLRQKHSALFDEFVQAQKVQDDAAARYNQSCALVTAVELLVRGPVTP